MGRRGKRALADRRRWLADLARVVHSAYPERPADRPRELAEFIAACDLFGAALDDEARPLRVHVWMAAPTTMGPARWPVPALGDLATLARWLRLTPAHLDWFADRRSFERTAGDRELARRAARIITLVETIAADEGFRVNDLKTRVRTAAQRQAVTGLTVNRHPNVARGEYARLRAVLHHAARHGPGAANRDGHADFRAHVLGRIGWVGAGNEARAAKLDHAFAAINW